MYIKMFIANYFSQALAKVLRKREIRYWEYMALITWRVKNCFVNFISATRYSGNLEICHKKQTIHLVVSLLKVVCMPISIRTSEISGNSFT